MTHASTGPRGRAARTSLTFALMAAAGLPLLLAGCVTREVLIRSKPEAHVYLDGIPRGETPFSARLVWKDDDTVHRIEVRKENYEGRKWALTRKLAERAEDPWVFDVKLEPLERTIPVHIIASTPDATVYVDEKEVGTTPLTYNFTFKRKDASSPWSTFLIRCVKDGFRWKRPGGPLSPGDISPYVATITLREALRGELHIPLEPIRFYRTNLRYPEFTPKGLRVVSQVVLAERSIIETEPAVKSVTRMTDFKPGALMRTRIWVTPDYDLVFAIPFEQPDTEDLLSNLWRRLASGALARLTDELTIDMDASVTPEGEYCYFAANRIQPNKYNLWRISMVGQGGFAKITDSPSSAADTYASLSPDGTRLVYQSMMRDGEKVWQIWVADADGSTPTQLRLGEQPAWSPDSKRIAYIAPDDDGLGKHIWIMDADGSHPVRLTTGDRAHEFPVWTPDGRYIVYASDESYNPTEGCYNMDIWLIDVHTAKKTRLTANGSYDTSPAISPDGRYVYFISNRGTQKEFGDNWQIWRMELDTSLLGLSAGNPTTQPAGD